MQRAVILLLAGLIGLLAGFVSGMFGIGGGSVRTPLLYLLGFGLIIAFGINLFTIPFSSAVGAFSHRENLDKQSALYMIIGGCLGSGVGAFLAYIFSLSDFKLLLAIIYVVISILTVIGIYLYKIAPDFSAKLEPKPYIIIPGAFILNLITGMKGGSGGSLFPPFLKTLGLEMKKAIATSLFTTIFTAIVAIGIFWWKGQILWLEGVIVMVGSIIGTQVGSLLSIKTKNKWLELGLAILTILLASITLLKAIFW
ncbi:MAG: sulfite exporter TauE/SafE family protein [Asgard group archaeon]|nr:sulfite exporter TauE/SafE family protein [Asgard group archaeon]